MAIHVSILLCILRAPLFPPFFQRLSAFSAFLFLFLKRSVFLLIDIFFGHLGFYALIYMYLGFLVGKLNEVFYSQNIAIPITIISVSDFIYNFVCYVLLLLFRKQFDIGYYMMNTIIPGVVYTALVAIFYYPVILKIHEWILEKEQRSEKKFV